MENPIKMDDLGVPLFSETLISTRQQTYHSFAALLQLSLNLAIDDSPFCLDQKWTNPSSPVESISFKRVSSITTLDFQDTVGFWWFWISWLSNVALYSVEKWSVKIKLAWRDLPFATATTLKFTKNKSVLSAHHSKIPMEDLAKALGDLWCLSFAPREKKNTVAWKLLLSCRVQILGIWAQVLGAKRPKIRLPLRAFLVGGWANPFQNYARQIRSFPPRDPGENTKYLKPAPSFFWRHLC